MTKAYNWNDLPLEKVRPGVERCGFRGDHAMLVLNRLHPGMDVRPHQHDFEQLIVCVQGTFLLHVGNEVISMTPGSMVRVPPHTMHCAEPDSEEVALNLDVFAPAREDYLHLTSYLDGESTAG